MMDKLWRIGIYTDAISNAIESSENLLRKFNFDDDAISEMNEWAIQDIEEVGLFTDITNSIIRCYFSAAKEYVERFFKDADISYYVNCHDSHLYCNGKEV